MKNSSVYFCYNCHVLQLWAYKKNINHKYYDEVIIASDGSSVDPIRPYIDYISIPVLVSWDTDN